jgi:hypothetical protein
MLPRADTVEYGMKQGKDSVKKVVRATNKPGAILTARLDAIRNIPLRSQSVARVEIQETDRLLNKWVVEIRDNNELENLGR